MHRRRTILVSGVAVALLFLCYLVRFAVVHVFHDDACLVIAKLVADKAEKGEPVSDLQLRGEIAGLIHASVIHGRVDKDGKPTDLNGNDFQVNQTAGRVTVSTKFSFFQPIRSHRQADIKLHNKPAAGNAGSTPQVVVQHGLAGVPEPGRSA